LRAKKEGEETQEPLVLFEGNNNPLNYTFVSNDGMQIRTDELYFSPSSSQVSVTGDSATLTMTAALNADVSISQVYTLKKDGFMMNYDLVTKGFDQVQSLSNNDFQVGWSLDLPLQEQSLENEKNMSSVFYQFKNGDHDYITETKYEEVKAEGGSLEWISFKQQFFNSTLISRGEKGFEDAEMATVELQSTNKVQGMKATWFLDLDGSANDSVPM